MNGPASQAVQHGSFFFSYGNVALPGKLNDIFYFTGMRFARDVYALNGNAARTDGFKHGVDTADTILHYSRNTNATASAAMASSVPTRSEEHTSELQSHSFISYAVFCL